MFSVAVDGPSGVGKSSVSREVAKRLGFVHLDTGALYRALAYYAVKNDIINGFTSDELGKIRILVEFKDYEQHILLNGRDVTNFLRDEVVSKVSSRISKEKSVRDFLINTQRDIAKKSNIIMDGRDIGTVVLPDANLKIFLTANPEVRAKRRFLELKEKNKEITSFSEVLAKIIKRDNEDSTRKIAPLRPSPDTIILDTSTMSFDETVLKIVKLIEKNFNF